VDGLFESELSARCRAAAPAALGIVSAGLAFLVLADAPDGWSAWVVLPLALLPALVNALSAAAAARDGRDRLFALLPLPRWQTGLVRAAAPLAFQIAGGAAAVVVCLVLSPFDPAASGLISLVLVAVAWLLLVGQIATLHGDLQSRPWGRRLRGAPGAAATVVAALASTGTVLGGLWLAAGAAGRGLVASAAVVVTHPWDLALASLAAALLVIVNAALFVSRDVTAT